MGLRGEKYYYDRSCTGRLVRVSTERHASDSE